MTPPTNSRDIVAFAASSGVAALTLYLLVVGQGIVLPFVMAIFLTYLIIAATHALQRPMAGRRLPFGAALGVAVFLFFVLIALLVQIVAGNIGAVVDAAPEYQERLQGLLDGINRFIAESLGQERPLSLASIVNELDLRAILGRFAGAFQAIAGSTVQIFAYVFFLLLEYGTADRKIKALFPDAGREAAVRATIAKIGGRIETYVLIKTFISFLTGTASYIVLRVAGIDFAAFWALLIFVLNFMPYVGTPIGIAFPTLLALLQFDTPATAAIVLGCLIGVQTAVENGLEPRLMGNSLNLSPVVMILSLSVWGALWGITGMILAVPLMVILMITFAQFPATRPVAIMMSASGNPD
jgi:predicted PurR-regulated permease PerM